MLVDSSVLMILSLACQSICTSQFTWINYVFLIYCIARDAYFLFLHCSQFSALVSKTGKKIANVFVIKTFFSAFGLSLYTQRLLTNDATVFRNRIHFFQLEILEYIFG